MELIRPKKIALQLKYVHERSFWTDLKIIFLTFQALVRPQSAAVRELRTATGTQRTWALFSPPRHGDRREIDTNLLEVYTECVYDHDGR